MAVGYLPKPGSEVGPCVLGCEHKDCRATTAKAEGICGLCGQPIGFGRGFYDDNDHGTVHASCLEDALS